MTVPRDPQVLFSPREQVLTTDGVTQVWRHLKLFTSVPPPPDRRGEGVLCTGQCHTSLLPFIIIIKHVTATKCTSNLWTHDIFSEHNIPWNLFVSQFDASIVLKVSWGISYRNIISNLQHQVRREVRSQVNISSYPPGSTLALQLSQGNSKVTRFPCLGLNFKYNCLEFSCLLSVLSRWRTPCVTGDWSLLATHYWRSAPVHWHWPGETEHDNSQAVTASS